MSNSASSPAVSALTTNVGVILACHNRRQKTVDCLRALGEQEAGHQFSLDVFLFDDGSSDGTSDAVAEEFPNVTVLRGDGSAYWGGGMRAAWKAALDGDRDEYLWLNDDTVLDPGAIQSLFECKSKLLEDGHQPGIIVGSTRCPETGDATYGGLKIIDHRRPFRFEVIQSEGQPARCDTMHGNCVLISRETVLKLGNISATYRHICGDHDYGLRAVKAGIEVWTTGGYVGTCEGNPFRDSWNSRTYQPNRLRTMFSVKGLPTREWYEFTRSHGGTWWPLYYASPYLKASVLSVADRLGLNSMATE